MTRDAWNGEDTGTTVRLALLARGTQPFPGGKPPDPTARNPPVASRPRDFSRVALCLAAPGEEPGSTARTEVHQRLALRS